VPGLVQALLEPRPHQEPNERGIRDNRVSAGLQDELPSLTLGIDHHHGLVQITFGQCNGRHTGRRVDNRGAVQGIAVHANRRRGARRSHRSEVHELVVGIRCLPLFVEQRQNFKCGIELIQVWHNFLQQSLIAIDARPS
jgi:hypothetical protein